MTRDAEVLESMRRDWNQRAREDANYYVAFGRRDQDDAEFFATVDELMQSMRAELKRLPANASRKALEIGCGPGRLMRPASAYFSEIHGVDISDEMVKLAAEKLRDIPHAHVHATNGSDLSGFADNYFDFVYSYAVFQHIPSREVVFEYLTEARRVLKPGGILWCQFNCLPELIEGYDTWEGVRIPSDEIAAFMRAHDLQLLRLDDVATQYTWITCRKQMQGWCDWLEHTQGTTGVNIWNIVNAHSGDGATPASGRFAAAALLIENLPLDCDLNHMEVRIDGRAGRICYIGPPQWDRVCQINVRLPDKMRSGLAPVEVDWMGKPLCAPAWMRIIPPGPLVPQIYSFSDGTDQLSATRIVTDKVKVKMEGVASPELLRAAVDGKPVLGIEFLLTDPWTRRFEFNLRLPQGIEPGPHQVEVRLGRRQFMPIAIEVG